MSAEVFTSAEPAAGVGDVPRSSWDGTFSVTFPFVGSLSGESETAGDRFGVPMFPDVQVDSAKGALADRFQFGFVHPASSE